MSEFMLPKKESIYMFNYYNAIQFFYARSPYKGANEIEFRLDWLCDQGPQQIKEAHNSIIYSFTYVHSM